MADTPISGLPSASALAVADTLPVVQGAVTKEATFRQVADLIHAENSDDDPLLTPDSDDKVPTKSAVRAAIDIAISDLSSDLGGAAGTVTHTAGALTASALMVGNGADDAKVLASLGTTTTLLHGNAAGLPTFGAVSLTADVTGVLPVANFATGTPSGTKFVRDDGVLAVPAGSGTVTIVRNAQTGTSYALDATDRGKHVTLSNAAAISVTIAQAGTAGFEDGYYTFVETIGLGNATITPATSTINGAANIVLNGGMSALITSDGTNYRAFVWQRGGVLVNAQTGTSYTYLSSDRGKLITHANGSTIAGTLPIATGAFGAGWWAIIQNTGVGDLILTPTTSTIDGVANLTLTTDQGILVASDGTNYFTFRGRGSGGGSLTNWTESVGTSAPNGTINAAIFTAISAGASGSAIIEWKGASGFFAVQEPDNTSTGGNLRGPLAFDGQANRASADQVASGTSSALLGTVNGKATGTSGVGIAGNTVTASGDQSLATGTQTEADGPNAVVIGAYGKARGAQSFVQASGSSSIGRRQDQRFVIWTSSSFSNALRTLTTDGGAAGATTMAILPNNSVYGFTARVVMLGGSDYFDVEIKGTAYRGANAAATVIDGVTTTIAGVTMYETAGVAGLGWAIDAIADTTEGGIAIRTKGDTGQIVTSSCIIDTIQLTP